MYFPWLARSFKNQCVDNYRINVGVKRDKVQVCGLSHVSKEKAGPIAGWQCEEYAKCYWEEECICVQHMKCLSI